MDRTITVRATAAAPRAVRAAVRETLAGHQRLDDALLVASELVASAVRAASGEVTVHITGPAPVRIDVVDQRGTHPYTHQPQPGSEVPDPLGLVSLLASVGSHRHASGDCTTWAALSPAPIPARSSQPHP